MALMLHASSSSSSSSSSSFITNNKPNLFLRTPYLKPTNFFIKSQQDSSTEGTTSGASSKESGNSSTGLGFGSSASAPAAAPAKKKPSKGKRERASIIRREPIEKPSFTTQQEAGKVEELKKNDSAFLLAWLGLGAIILIEGIALAASGFLPEAWDNFFVKYLYPSFTPTVFLFVAGTVAYGVLKYLQNEKSSTEN